MNKYLEQHKEKARTKSLTNSDMIAHCVFKAVIAKSDQTFNIYKYFARQAFTPRKNKSYAWEGFKNACWSFIRKHSNASWNKTNEDKFQGIELKEVFDIDQITKYKELLVDMKGWTPDE